MVLLTPKLNISIELIPSISSLIWLALLIFIWGFWNYIKKPSQSAFLIDFACYKPPPTQMATKEKLVQIFKHTINISEEFMDILRMAMDRIGIGDSTYLPEALLREPPNICMKESIKEAQNVMFGTLDMLFEKTKVDPKEIGILIVNCSIFGPVPSLSCMIVNQYKMNENVLSYNLGGMGCSAGLLSIRLANQLLQVHKDTYALILSTENTTGGIYFGLDRSKFIPNCTFRVGGAAILLSNRSTDRNSCKYELIHDVHTHAASCDISYNSIFQEEDDDGITGVSITKDLLVGATRTIETNLTSLGPLILPLSEKYLFLKNLVTRKLFGAENVKKYVPNFSTSVDHFISHTGGMPVLNQLQKNLGFSDEAMEASKITLRRFGNTSSSSIWYVLAYLEAQKKIKKGDQIWQMAFGSGFKCSSVIWRTKRDVDSKDMRNPWSEEKDGLVNLKLNNTETAYDYFEPPKTG